MLKTFPNPRRRIKGPCSRRHATLPHGQTMSTSEEQRCGPSSYLSDTKSESLRSGSGTDQRPHAPRLRTLLSAADECRFLPSCSLKIHDLTRSTCLRFHLPATDRPGRAVCTGHACQQRVTPPLGHTHHLHPSIPHASFLPAALLIGRSAVMSY